MLNALEKSILNALTYFNLFNFPLTEWEIKKYIYSTGQTGNLLDINNALNSLRNKFLCAKEGFYFLKGRDIIVNTRKRRYLFADKKIRRAKPFFYLLSKMPFIKAVFICNNLAYQNAPGDSDIDLAIVTAKNRIWTGRFFSTALIKILRKRPTIKTQQNKICLSFYLTEDNLNLENIAYPNDIHFTYWLAQFLPIYDPHNFAECFFQANEWIKTKLPNIFPINAKDNWTITKNEETKKTKNQPTNKENNQSPPLQIKRDKLETAGNVLEKILKKIQLAIMPEYLKIKAQENGKDVIINDKILKFHTKDNRLDIYNQWSKAVADLLK